MRTLRIVAFCAVLGGCVTNETIEFRASGPQQQAMMRDGQSALVSKQKFSLVLVQPATRKLEANGRPVFVIGINNLSKGPVDFRVAQVEVNQIVGAQEYPMQVVTYEMLAQEENNRRVGRALLAGVAVAANTYSASRTAGQGTFSSTTYGPRGGVYQTTGTFHDPAAAAIAQNRLAAQNEALVAATIERGQRNMAQLEQSVIKDNTLLPGEWYGGQLHLAPPATTPEGTAKSYKIILTVGGERHVIEVSQTAVRT